MAICTGLYKIHMAIPTDHDHEQDPNPNPNLKTNFNSMEGPVRISINQSINQRDDERRLMDTSY